MDIIIPLLLALAAGLSTTIGAFIIFFTKKYNQKLLIFSLTIAASIMITVSLIKLIPNGSFTLIKQYGFSLALIIIIISILVGIAFSHLIEVMIPDNTNKMKRIGIFTMVAVMLHNLPEGIITFMAGYSDINLGITLAIAIALHNIPEGISIAMPIYYATGSKLKAFTMTLISGLTEPLGALLTYLLLRPFITNTNLAIMCLIVAGIMLYIAINKLIPNAYSKGMELIMLLAFILGFVIMIISELLL